MTTGRISVVLPVYNGEKYLAQAIDSILCQTYSNFELLVIIDGSKDGSFEVASQYTDPRIKIFNLPQNLGLVGALNYGLEASTGEFIARMDQDDLSDPDRFHKQVEYFHRNPGVDILGTGFQTFGYDEQLRRMPESNEEINITHFFNSPLCHPTVMMRANRVKLQFKLIYPAQFKDIEDWAMWHQGIVLGLNFGNLPDILLKYRIAGQSTTPQQREIRRPQYKMIYQFVLPSLFDKNAEQYIDIHYAINSLEISEYSGNQLAGYFRIIRSALISKGFSRILVQSILDKLNHRVFCKLADRSSRSAIAFMFMSNSYSAKKIRYLLASIKKR